MMTHFNELHLILNKYLKWNKSHAKCFTLIMLALIVGYTDLMVDGAPLPHQPDTIIRWLIDRLRS